MVNFSGQQDGPGVVLCDGLACDGFAWRYLRPQLDPHFRVMHLHYRGHGRSGLPPSVGDCTLPLLARDIEELMTRTNQPPSTFVGHSMGVQVTLEMALRYPERVRAGVLLCGPHGRALDTFKGFELGARVLPTIRNFVNRYRDAVRTVMGVLLPTDLAFRVAQAMELNRDFVKQTDFMDYLEHAAKMPPDLFMTLVTDIAERTSEHFFDRIRQPMLVVAAENDGVTPSFTSVEMHKRLPNAEFELIAHGSHAAIVERPEAVNTCVMGFLERHRLKEPRRSPEVPPMTLGQTFRAAAASA